MAQTYAFTHDPQRCIKCFTCEVACKQWRSVPPATFRLRRVYEEVDGSFPRVTRTFHSVSCQHCPDAPCIGVCAPGALSKRGDGVVVVDGSKCDGCRDCLQACPFDVPDFDADGILQLCDLCSDRLAEGGQPLCADVCPTQALKWNPAVLNS